MIIMPDGARLSIKTPVELSHDATQLLIDAEVFWAGLALDFQLRCIACMRSGNFDGAYCVGGVNEDATAFTVECGCTKRIGRGHFTAPLPPPSPHPREHRDEKRHVTLTRDEAATIRNFETLVFEQLKLQYLLRCMRCRLEGSDRDGATGVKETTANRIVIECPCSIRTYQGADAPMLTH